jgi:hypothetical protein
MPERHTPETCTCGATLVGNARFCHLCGRPVFESLDSEIVEAAQLPPHAPPVAAPAPSAPIPISFGNPIALRAAFLTSLAIMLLETIPGVNLLFPLWWLGGGWCSVLLYRRLTGFALSVRAGARLGSITGILAFLSMAILLAIAVTVEGKAIFQPMPSQDPRISQMLGNPAVLAATFALVLLIIFAMVVGTCAAGGALGARFAGRSRADSQV